MSDLDLIGFEIFNQTGLNHESWTHGISTMTSSEGKNRILGQVLPVDYFDRMKQEILNVVWRFEMIQFNPIQQTHKETQWKLSVFQQN